MNFLIVEDDNIQLTGLKHIIEEEYADAVVNTASTYNDAITIIDSFDIDIFLLDIDLGGGKTGLDVCASGHHKHIFTSDGDFIVTNPTFESILQAAGDVPLVRCHKSYYFNPDYIQSYDRSNSLITLKLAQESIPVGRKYKTIIETYQENR